MNPDQRTRPLTTEELEPADAYYVTWMGRDGEYGQRRYLMSDVIISTQDQALVVVTQGVTPLILLLVPIQRVVQVELVAG